MTLTPSNEESTFLERLCASEAGPTDEFINKILSKPLNSVCIDTPKQRYPSQTGDLHIGVIDNTVESFTEFIEATVHDSVMVDILPGKHDVECATVAYWHGVKQLGFVVFENVPVLRIYQTPVKVRNLVR
jgi:hypothetical protein